MKCNLCFLFLLFLSSTLQAQYSLASYPLKESAYSNASQPFSWELPSYQSPYKRKLLQRNYGAIIGIQRGAATSFEFGAEAHWRKLSLKKPNIVGATANIEYNFGNHIIGYKAGMWKKTGRVNLTYGGNLVYFSDFEGRSRYGIGPAVGFRLLGFHLVNGINILAGDKEMKDVNTLYISLRYYFPIENKFTWDRKTLKKKERAKKERAKAKELRQKEREKQKEDKPTLLERLKRPFSKE